jgi:hypothetical protein
MTVRQVVQAGWRDQASAGSFFAAYLTNNLLGVWTTTTWHGIRCT